MHGGMIGEVARLDRVLCRRPRVHPCTCNVHRQIEHKREIRTVRAHAHSFKRIEMLRPDAARRDLIGPRRIRKAIADHPCPARQRRPDRAIEMIAARCVEQQRLRDSIPSTNIVRRIEDQTSQRLRARRPAGFSRPHNLDALRGQLQRQRGRKRGLAYALAALKRYEPTTMRQASITP